VPTAYLSPSQLKELTDVSVNPGAPQDGYPLIWNQAAGRWQAGNNIAGVTIRAGAGADSQAIGSTANSSGFGWIAQGPLAGISNTVGGYWTAQSGFAGTSNSIGNFWTAQGVRAGNSNVGGFNWTAQGPFSALNNTVGDAFLAQGYAAGAENTTGSYWTAQGFEAGVWDGRSSVLNIASGRSKSLICGNFANDCIYFGHVGPITSSANVPIPTAAVHAAASNTTRASLRIDAGIAPTTPNTGDIWVNSSNNSLNFQIPLVNLQGTQVLATRRTGWAAPTGTATRTSFDTATATTTQLAERLKALIDDLTTHGLIGT
jgi:hypothetical protein